MSVGKSIKLFRRSNIQANGKRLSQLDLSLAIGWENPSTLSRIEQGEVKPTRETLIKIAKALHLNLTDINALLKDAGYLSYENPLDDVYMDEVVKSIKDDFNQHMYPMLLLAADVNCMLGYWNTFAQLFFLKKILPDTEFTKEYRRINHIQLLFDSSFHVKEHITNWKELSKILVENVYFVNNRSIKIPFIQDWIRTYPEFRKLWDICEQNHSTAHTSYNITFNYDHPDMGMVHLILSTFGMHVDKRFFVEQLTPAKEEDGKKLFQYMREYNDAYM